MAEDRNLPGMPRKRLVREVKRVLRHYGIVPTTARSIAGPIWLAAWKWASDVARSYQRFDSLLHKRHRERWPAPSEIAAQYVVLLLAELQRSPGFRLPYRARDYLPQQLAQAGRIAQAGPLMLPAPAPTTTQTTTPTPEESTNATDLFADQ